MIEGVQMSVRFLICFFVVGGLAFPGPSAAQVNSAPKSQGKRKLEPAKPEKDLGPFTLLGVLEGLKNYEPLEPGRMVELVKKRGVSFIRGPEITAILKEAGASDALLDLISEPPAPPPPKLAGDLTVGCAPRDCEVVVDSRYQGPTQNGRKRVAGLKAGDVNITVFSDGYDRATKRVTLVENRPLEQVFTLEPSPNTRLQLGAKFMFDTVNALGGVMAIAEFPPAAGTVELATPNGPVQYKIRYAHSSAGETLDISGQNVNCPALLTRDGVRPQCKGKPKPGVAETVEQVAQLVWAHDLGVLLDRALSGTVNAEAWLDARRLTSVTPSATMTLLITADHLPIEIDIEPKQGRAEKVLYSDYATAGKQRYPRKTSVVQNGKPIASIQLQ